MRSTRVLALTLATFIAAVPTASARDQLKSGDRGADVQTLRFQLTKLGYLPSGSSKGTVYDTSTMHGVMAYQKVRGLDRDGVAGPQTRKALKRSADANSRTKPALTVAGSGKRIEVDISQQVAKLISGGRVQRVIAVSSGRAGFNTPQGSFKVFRKELNSWSVPYKVNLPYASYFVGGVAFHGYPDVPAYAASHSCVRVPSPFAPEVYSFAGQGVRVDVLP